jgi:hypothetical protein
MRREPLTGNMGEGDEAFNLLLGIADECDGAQNGAASSANSGARRAARFMLTSLRGR